MKTFRSLLFLIAVFNVFSAAGQWKPVGPIKFPINESSQIHGIGRICQMKFHPSDPTKAYAASASGGLWISKTFGNTWEQCGTDNLPSLNCASVCINYKDDNVLYLGTGDPNYYVDHYGVYKSVNGGMSWTRQSSGIGNKLVVEILMHPTDTAVLVAATSNGIWKTINGGATWTVKKSAGAFTDMVMRPEAGSTTLYAVDMEGAYFKSSDMGETWRRITTGLSIPGANAMGTRLAVSAANPEVLYLSAIAGGGTVFKSVDGGESFTTVYSNPTRKLTGYDEFTEGQGNYNFGMGAHPENADIVFVVAHCVWKSTDGGITWSRLTNWFEKVHTDMHQITFSPYDPSRIFNLNDGGIWLSTSGGSGWAHRSEGLATTECVHAANSPMSRNLISIGTQDNGELYYNIDRWYTNRGGDWYSAMQYDYWGPTGHCYYADNARRRNVAAKEWETSFGVPFVTNSTMFGFQRNLRNMAYAWFYGDSAAGIYRTTNLGSITPAWEKILDLTSYVRHIAFAPDDPNVMYILLANNKLLRTENAQAGQVEFTELTIPGSALLAGSVAPGKAATGKVYVSAGSRVYYSEDKGASWTNISGTIPNINILKIYFDEYSQDNSIYIGSARGVYYRNDSLQGWINYSYGLPTVTDITEFMIYNDGTSNSALRVAYYGRGVWERPLYQYTVGIQPVTPPKDFSINVFPNPAREAFEVSFAAEPGESYYLSLIAADGRLAWEQQVKAGQQQEKITVKGDFAPGIYTLGILNRGVSQGHNVVIR